MPRGQILDVGCGTGALAQRLAGEGYEVTGVDPSDGMLDVLRERAPSITAVHGDGTDLPFEDDSFDLAYCVAVMHHVAEPEAVRKTLAEMVRVTRSGGRVLVWDHNPRNPYWSNLMGRVPQDTGEERLIPEEELLDGLRAGGAEPLLSAQLGFVPDFVPRGRWAWRSARSGRSSGSPACAGSPPTTSSWRRPADAAVLEHDGAEGHDGGVVLLANALIAWREQAQDLVDLRAVVVCLDAVGDDHDPPALRFACGHPRDLVRRQDAVESAERMVVLLRLAGAENPVLLVEPDVERAHRSRAEDGGVDDDVARASLGVDELRRSLELRPLEVACPASSRRRSRTR